MSARPIPNVRWRIAALLFTATVINYIDRQTLSVLAPEITAELGLSNIAYSNVVQAFLISYASMYIVWGLVIDRWGTRLALATSMVWWSLANAGHALARGAFGLGAFRALLGIGESGNFSGCGESDLRVVPAQGARLRQWVSQRGGRHGCDLGAAGDRLDLPNVGLAHGVRGDGARWDSCGWRSGCAGTGSRPGIRA